jgi:hypothetical protein
MKLHTIHLPAGNLPSISVKPAGAGWTGQTVNFLPFWRYNGYDGVHIVGKGKDETIIGDHVPISLLLSRHGGCYVLENLSIKCGPVGGTGKGRGILVGNDAANVDDPVHTKLVLKNCRVFCPDEWRTAWGVHSYQTDLVYKDTIFDMKNSVEHASYAHGFSNKGALIERCEVTGVGAEGFKFTARPRTEYYPEGWDYSRSKHHEMDGMHPPLNGPEQSAIRIYHTTIRDWEQEWSWRGGGGVVIQGAGANVHLKGNQFYARDDHRRGRCIMIDDGGWEHFSPDGIAGEPPANGHILIEECLMVGAGSFEGTWPNAQPLVRIGKISGNLDSGQIARSFQMKDCGLYGPQTILEIQNMSDKWSYEDCNTEEVGAIAKTLIGDDWRLAEVANTVAPSMGYDPIGHPALET